MRADATVALGGMRAAELARRPYAEPAHGDGDESEQRNGRQRVDAVGDILGGLFVAPFP
jgi:hypothetical protein